MKAVVYILLTTIAMFLFWPTTDGRQIRNLPLLIVLLVIIADLEAFSEYLTEINS